MWGSMAKPTAVIPGPSLGLTLPEVFRLLVENVTDYAIFVVDPAGIIRSWNSGAERLKGYGAEEIIGRNFSVFHTADDLAEGQPAEELRVAARTGRHEDEGWRVRKDGSRFWADVVTTRILDETGKLIGFGKITRDLSERRNAELRYRILVESVMDYAIFSMDATGRITSWNVGAQRIKGYSADEIVGKHFSAFYTPEDRAGGMPERVLETATREGHFEGEGWRVRKDGSRFWANVVVTALRDAEGRLTGFSKVTKDNTERKALLDEINRHAQELELRVREREESNAELEAFAYSVSHDLRAPLRAIAGFAEALGEDYRGRIDERGREYLDEITGAVNRMNVLVQDLLDYGRISRINLKVEPVSVAATVKAAAGQLGNERRGSLTVQVPDSLMVRGHPQVLTQVLFNLLSNAFKFHVRDAEPEVRVWAEASDGVVRLNVRDNGIGIAPEHQERIWQVFERLHDRDTYPGTGIGLAIVRRATLRMQGSCGVESRLGEGSTFWIELPRGGISNRGS